MPQDQDPRQQITRSAVQALTAPPLVIAAGQDDDPVAVVPAVMTAGMSAAGASRASGTVSAADLFASLGISPLIDSVDNLDRLAAQVRTPLGIVPFVGAGLSAPYGYPAWGSFLRDQAAKTTALAEASQLLDDGRFEDAAELVRKERGYRAFQNALQTVFGPQSIPLMLPADAAALLLPRLSRGPVLTTNYDHVLENVYRKAGKPFDYVVWGARADIVTRAFRQDMSLLVKLHGDADDSTDRVLTKRDYDHVYANTNSPLPALLRQIFASPRPLLFLGSSLAADRTMAVLDETVAVFREGEHFAVVEAPDGSSPPELFTHQRELSERNISPIWYPHGRHDAVRAILLNVAAGMPD